jgi:ribosome biogenesis GTPase
LEALGWNPFFDAHWNRRQAGDEVPARVAEESKDLYRLYVTSGEYLAEVSGRLRYLALGREELPAVGDWVAAALRPDEGRATIHAVLPRRTVLVRKAPGRETSAQVVAANVDTVFVTTSLNRDLNPRRLERYLALVWESGARPVVLLNKADLCADAESVRAEVAGAAAGAAVLAVSARTGEGLGALAPYLAPGATLALVGSSGVGKSTLINRLLGEERLAVRAVRDDDRGRHATTFRQLVRLPGGALLVDTPGMRELGLWDAAEGLGHAFEDVEALARHCRFRDCRHADEPGCAVRAATQAGNLPADRLENYRKLERELRFLVRKKDKAAEAAERARWRKLHKLQKEIYKHRSR